MELCQSLKSPLRCLTYRIGISGRNRSDVPRMDFNENRERRESELFSAEIREDAGENEESNAGGHRGKSRESRGDWADPEAVQVRNVTIIKFQH